MNELDKDRIKRKIKALLEKTTENGATEQEMNSALMKANQLMSEFFISNDDLLDPYIGEKILSKELKLPRSGYDVTMFLGNLCELFDCEHVWFTQTKDIVFYGYSQDLELCTYFYEFIIKTLQSEAKKFRWSSDYWKLQRNTHGRTIMASFVKGFLKSLTMKLRIMYENRISQFAQNYNAMTIYDNKKDKIKIHFDNLHSDRKFHDCSQEIKEARAFLMGTEIADEIDIVQAIHHKEEEKILQIDK